MSSNGSPPVQQSAEPRTRDRLQKIDERLEEHSERLVGVLAIQKQIAAIALQVALKLDRLPDFLSSFGRATWIATVVFSGCCLAVSAAAIYRLALR